MALNFADRHVPPRPLPCADRPLLGHLLTELAAAAHKGGAFLFFPGPRQVGLVLCTT
ncbi:hypothetical protein GCM10017744_079990 [Streptomyces antimycoticus]|uniref:Uncharacterized protein n=1 Tax=Streptomyces antimycoticus TaxID=68175 RepID=A0A4D4JZI6_9ACTN|nr:hypothetical protein SANT12839_021340 [Streptomyces antimycoticus]